MISFFAYKSVSKNYISNTVFLDLKAKKIQEVRSWPSTLPFQNQHGDLAASYRLAKTRSCGSQEAATLTHYSHQKYKFLLHLIVKADHHRETKRGQCHHFIMIYFSALAEMEIIWFLELVIEFPFSWYPYAGKRNLKIIRHSQCHYLIIMYFLLP